MAACRCSAPSSGSGCSAAASSALISASISSKRASASACLFRMSRRLASTSASFQMESRMACCSAISSDWATTNSASAFAMLKPGASSSGTSSSMASGSSSSSCSSVSGESGGRPVAMRAARRALIFASICRRRSDVSSDAGGATPHGIHTTPMVEAAVGPSGFPASPRGATPSGRRGERARAPPYPPHIWAGYGGCWSARTFEAGLRGSSGSLFRDRSMNERPARTFEEDRRGLAVDALSWSRKQLLPVWALEEFGRNKRADAKRSPVRFNKTRSTSHGRRPRPTPDPATPTPKPKHRRTCRSPRTHGRTDGGEPASQPAAAEKVSSGSWAVGGELTRKRSLSLSVLHSPPPPPPSPPLPHSIPLGSVWNPGRGKPPVHGILPPQLPNVLLLPDLPAATRDSVRPRPDPVKSSCWQTP